MGQQIIKQPNGKFAIFDSVSDTIVIWDAIEQQIVQYFIEQAAEEAGRSAKRQLGAVADGHPERAYHQFAMTWDEALRDDRDSGGNVWREWTA